MFEIALITMEANMTPIRHGLTNAFEYFCCCVDHSLQQMEIHATISISEVMDVTYTMLFTVPQRNLSRRDKSVDLKGGMVQNHHTEFNYFQMSCRKDHLRSYVIRFCFVMLTPFSTERFRLQNNEMIC